MSTLFPEPYRGVLHLTEKIAAFLCPRKQKLAVAESCTGGLVAEWITRCPGSSAWFDRGVVTYSNQSKVDLLGVPWPMINDAGAVSGSTALAMADGLLNRSSVDWVISITGIAGPDGGTPKNRVGTVWISWTGRNTAVSASRFQFSGGRTEVRCSAAEAALSGLLSLLIASSAPSDKRKRLPDIFASKPNG